MRFAAIAVRTVTLTAVLALLSGCRRPDGPADRYRAFSAAARAGDAELVWSMLAARSRAALDERAKELASRTPGVIGASGKDLVVGTLGPRAARPRSVIVARESPDTAVVSVALEGGGPAREVTLVREAGAWRVVVPFDNQAPTP